MDFGIEKATEGTTYVNPFFQQNWEGIRAAGKPRGTYHFAHPEELRPLDEARFFLATVGALDPDDELWLDLEWVYQNNVDVTLADQGAWAYDWLTTVESLSGHKPGIYSSVAFMETHGLFIPTLQRFNLWLTAYDGKPDVPDGWTVTIWQTSGSGHIDGISGPVDTDTAA